MTEEQLSDLETRMSAGSDRIAEGPAIVTADEVRALIAEVRRLRGRDGSATGTCPECGGPVDVEGESLALPPEVIS